MKTRLQRLRNFQSDDFWAMIFARPLTILFLYPFIEKRWLTPNRVTTASLFVKLIALYFIAFVHTYTGAVWGAVLINLGLVLDNMDGTIARYHETSSAFGNIYDKVTDAVTFVLLFWAMGYRAWLITHSMWDIILPMAGVTGAFIANYSKWITEVVIKDLELKYHTKKGDLEEWATKKSAKRLQKLPPERTIIEWLKWLGSAFLSIFKFNEVDIYFFAALSLLTGWMSIFTRVESFFLIFGLIGGPIAFLLKIKKREAELK
ncbi:CDP-alcohol phosphatidyltransferase family protein [bacterium]|nr:CDP-alcohol phosphatidyltransferase family protein [bacterium]